MRRFLTHSTLILVALQCFHRARKSGDVDSDTKSIESKIESSSLYNDDFYFKSRSFQFYILNGRKESSSEFFMFSPVQADIRLIVHICHVT